MGDIRYNHFSNAGNVYNFMVVKNSLKMYRLSHEKYPKLYPKNPVKKRSYTHYTPMKNKKISRTHIHTRDFQEARSFFPKGYNRLRNVSAGCGEMVPMNTKKIVSWSELDALRQCNLKWNLAYRERWTPPSTGAALTRGTLFHAVLEQHYERLREIQEAEKGTSTPPEVQECLPEPENGSETHKSVAGLADSLRRSRGEQYEDHIELIEWIYDGYKQYWGEVDSDWTIEAVEKRVEVPLGVGRRSGIEFVLKGKIDLLVRDSSTGGSMWLIDHKTSANLPKQKDVDFDDQMGLYTWALRAQGYDVRGVVYNACRTTKLKTKKQPLDERFERLLTVRTDRELDCVAAEALETFDVAWSAWPDGVTPPRTPDSDRCGWRCPFTEACLMGRKTDQDVPELLSAMDFQQEFVRH